tara:strand:+ start:2309 stop:2734 length:426 start_codon:yes stop_codon:yes gene_type:complete
MNKILFILICILIISCSNETIYSGKILNQENLSNINFENKEKLINILGIPSYIDPIENKFFYFTEKKEKKTILRKDIEYSYIFVFKFNKNDIIVQQNVYDLSNSKEISLITEETDNNIIKRGLIEKVFGGVGPQQELPTTQ